MADYNESQINSNETERISAEQQRIENETKRQTKETEREARETTRQSNESTRISKEAERLVEEVNRVQSEASRITAEQSRVKAEGIRAEFYEGFNERLDVVEECFNEINEKNAVCVTDYGMDKKGESCCSDIFISIINDVISTKRKIYFPVGVYKFTKPININGLNNINLVIEGESSSEGNNYSTRIEYHGNGVFLSLDGVRTLKIKDVDIVGNTGSDDIFREGTTAIISSNSVEMSNCTVGGFENICEWNGGYYHTFDNVYVYHTKLAFKNFNANNLRFNRIKANRIGQFLTTTGGSGTVSVTNSSFERFTDILFSAKSGNKPNIIVNNCYFENYLEDTSTPTQLGEQYLGRVLYGFSGITLLSNTIFAKGITRFIYDNGNLRNLVSLGNLIKYSSTNSAMTQFIYHTNKLESVICNDVAVDDLNGDGTNSPIYINSLSTSSTLCANSSFVFNPFTKTYYDRNVSDSSNRPTKGLYQGYSFYDITLNKPIWYNGTNWVDYKGDIV